ncbi:MAG: acyl-CoA desaturase [Bacteroidetes bacterium]|nr:MAG: acyl-CoA desaturase [Bacteroidota bacterium]
MIQKPRFGSNDEANFFICLKNRVDDYFKESHLSKQGNNAMLFKTLAMLSLYFVPYFLILTGWFSIGFMALLVVAMAFGKAGIGMSVMHDANHGAYSSKKWLNGIMGNMYYLLGGSPKIWKIQHNVLHHTYTNVHEVDEDIETKFILRLSPHATLKPIHKYQYLYAFALYCLMTFSMLFKDFVKVFRYRQYNLRAANTSLTVDFLGEILSKTIYLTCTLLVPYLLLGLSFWIIFVGFLMLHFIAGLILSVIFQLAHVITETEHHNVEENAPLENTWAIHQLKSTANFAPHNRVLNWYVGGLNFQIEHHLFPHICHVHYPKLAKIVKNTALEFGLPYHEQPTFLSALRSHIAMLKSLGRPQMV